MAAGNRWRGKGTGVIAAAVLAAAWILGPAVPALAQGVLYAAAAATGAANCADPADACSLSTALAQVAAGGTVELVTPGDSARYVGNWTVGTPGTSASAPVTIQPAPGLASEPVLDGNGPSAPAGQTCSTSSCDGPVLTVPIGEFVALSGIGIADADDTSGGSFFSSGGGIDNMGTVTITGSTFTDDSAGLGGAIDNSDNGGDVLGTVTVTASTFTGNTAADGGAIENTHFSGGQGGSVAVSGSTFTDNAATDGGGAIDIGNGLDAFGSVSVTGSTFTGNTASDGAAIDNGDDDGFGSLTLNTSTFTGNQAGRDGGAIDTGDNDNTNDEGGGSLTVSAVTFGGNSAGDGGAIDIGDNGGRASVTVSDSTFAGNTATAGGAVDNVDGERGGGAVVTASTFAGNSSDIDNIVPVTVAADAFADGCAQGTGDLGYNVGVASCLDGGTGDFRTHSLRLGPLASNGGPTQTKLPRAGSPVLGVIPDPTAVTAGGTQVTLCPATDQRGDTSAPGPCDAGAVQVSAPLATTTTVSSAPNPSTAGQRVTFTATVAPTNGVSPLDGGGTVSFSRGTGARKKTICASRSLHRVHGSYLARCKVATLSAGSHVSTATYSGDENYVASTSTVTQVVSKTGGPPRA
jgi:hypothetical protein